MMCADRVGIRMSRSRGHDWRASSPILAYSSVYVPCRLLREFLSMSSAVTLSQET